MFDTRVVSPAGAPKQSMPTKRAILAVRLLLGSILALSLWAAAPARAAGIEYLQVPSAAMGRNISVAFQGGGPHAVVLLDAFNAAPDVSNWVTAGTAMDTFAGKGVSVVAPACGAFSFYTNWEQDGSKQWETFLASELPNWLAANKGLAPSGHAIVGASQGGAAALTLAAFYPGTYRYAGSMSGFMNPSSTSMNGAMHDGMMRFGGADTNLMWGPAQFGRWKWHDPYVHAQLFTNNNTRLWVFSPSNLTCADPAAMIGYCDQAQGSSRSFYSQYRQTGGNNGHFDFPAGGQHDWATWSQQLAAMSGDVAATIG
jgi:S-formylglutathione hydrolase FrmB